MNITIRQETPDDHAAIYTLTEAAFAEMEHADGDEQEMPARLRAGEGFLPELSLVAEFDGQLVGHVLFTEITIGGHPALCVGPLSVLPAFQRRGIGGALMEHGHDTARALGFSLCVLVGHEDYYPRFGYEPAGRYGITFPIDAPEACKMVKFLSPHGATIQGAVLLPPEHMPGGSE